jgi:hypothetical protein
MQSIWTDITPSLHALTEAHDGNCVMKPYEVSRDTRHSWNECRDWRLR